MVFVVCVYVCPTIEINFSTFNCTIAIEFDSKLHFWPQITPYDPKQ